MEITNKLSGAAMNKGSGSYKTYIVSLMQVCSLLCVALLLPRFFFNQSKIFAKKISYQSEQTFKLGIENLSSQFIKSLQGNSKDHYTVGVITNHTGVDQKGKRTIDILLSKGLPVKKILVPEDDFIAYKKGVNWQMFDEQTHLPIALLPHIDSLKKSKEYNFTGIDVIFFDLQDTGICPNTYLLTLAKTLQSACTQHKTVVVLDRPNLLGSSMEGMITQTAQIDNGLISLPMRHGMTLGELAQHFNKHICTKAARLFVVPMHHYTRSLFAEDSHTLHGNLLTSIDAYYGSSFLTILNNVSPFDVGVGTDMAFACLALPDSLHFPKQKWFELRTILKQQGIETSWCRYMNPKRNTAYSGLRLLVRNMDTFSPFNAITTIIQFFNEAGLQLTFMPEFDRTFGGKKMRDFLEGRSSRHDLEYEVNRDLKNFYNKAQSSFIYKPVPKIVLL